MKLRNIKIRIGSVQESKDVQNKLFSLGCAWSGGQTSFCHTDAPHLYVENNIITYGSNPDCFDKHNAENCTLQEIMGWGLNAPDEPTKKQSIKQLKKELKAAKKEIESLTKAGLLLSSLVNKLSDELGTRILIKGIETTDFLGIMQLLEKEEK